MGRSGHALTLLLPHESAYVDFLRIRKVQRRLALHCKNWHHTVGLALLSLGRSSCLHSRGWAALQGTLSGRSSVPAPALEVSRVHSLTLHAVSAACTALVRLQQGGKGEEGAARHTANDEACSRGAQARTGWQFLLDSPVWTMHCRSL